MAYACWPIALVHSLATGSDVRSAWSLTLTALCVLAVLGAVAVRALRGWPVRAGLRSGVTGTLLASPARR